MKEHPILFNTEMVKAVLDGRKIQTRRVLKPQQLGPERIVHFKDDQFVCGSNSGKIGIFDPNIYKCPYGQIGDRLWVRETWAQIDLRELFSNRLDSQIVYKAGPHPFERELPHMWTEGKDKWKPSIHMKREYCRINLEITDIRIERVQDISEEDAKSEGSIPGDVSMFDDTEIQLLDYPHKKKDTPFKNGFSLLWDSINEKRGFGWDVNPWVWVVEFKLIKT